MDDRRFDSLTKALAKGKSRRTVLKGLLGLGSAAIAGSIVLDGDSEAARRPKNPTPTPVRCPGRQIPCGINQCCCPPDAPNQCAPGGGPDCCTSVAGGPPVPTHSECCDNACCFGTCYGEELCCPTNNRSTGELPIPPTHKICETVDGPECCPFDDECCSVDGCCDGGCYGGADGVSFCCGLEHFCPGSPIGAGLCCASGERCCDGGTDNNNCYECCFDTDCPDGVCRNGTCVCLGLGEHCADAQECCQDAGETTCRDTIQCNAPQDTICCRPVGSVCGDNCDCCGTIPCEDGHCCLGQGMGACNGDSSNCCAGLECVGDPGDDSCRVPEPPCAGVGEQCGPGQSCCFVDACTSVSCQSGQCVAQPITCDDSNACTIDTCDPARGCVFTPVDCNDNNACTIDSCDPEAGCVYTAIDCDDGNACTNDFCDAAIGCVHTQVDCSGLDNPAECLVGVCSQGTCSSQFTCASGATCNGDGSCSGAGGCAPDGVACAGGLDCCEGCCIAPLSTFEDWVKVCTDAGLSGTAAQLCAQAIVDQGYPATCLNPPIITFPTFPDNPVTLPCFD
jgi:hypothetical protein